MHTGRMRPGRSGASGQTRKTPVTASKSPGAGGVIAARRAGVSAAGEAGSPSPPTTPSSRFDPLGRSRKVGAPFQAESRPRTLKHGAWAVGDTRQSGAACAAVASATTAAGNQSHLGATPDQPAGWAGCISASSLSSISRARTAAGRPWWRAT